MKVFKGRVVSTKMDKTAKVAVERVMVHPIYKKRLKRVKKYNVHDELGVEVGDEIRFVASRPYSKMKRWKIIEVISEKREVTRKTKQKKESKKPVTQRTPSSKKERRSGSQKKQR